jgi:integrase
MAASKPGSRPANARPLCGLRWAAVDLDGGLLFVERQRTTAGYDIVEGEPKTAAGRRAVTLDKHTVQILLGHSTIATIAE